MYKMMALVVPMLSIQRLTFFLELRYMTGAHTTFSPNSNRNP